MLYRIQIYNYFYERFKDEEIEFSVIADKFEKNDNIKFNHKTLEFNMGKYLDEIKNQKPDYVILFLHILDKVWAPIIAYCKHHNIPVIYWNHAFIRKSPKSVKNVIYRIQQNACDAIILYSEDERKYIRKRNKAKTFVANNTLNFDYFPEEVYSRNEFTEKYGIREDKIVLFVSRIQKRKKLDVLLDQFQSEKDIAVVIVGPGIDEESKSIVDKNSNFYYLGPIYDDYEVNSIFANCDVFSIPGANGLSINQAFYWGKPVVTMQGWQGPEIGYLKDGETGFIVKNPLMLKEKILQLLNDREMLSRFSENCKKVIKNEANIEKMYKGFYDAIKYCNRNSK